MNKENVLAVAAAIEGHTIPDLGFNMSRFNGTASDKIPDMSGHHCGTIACVAGWSKAVRSSDPVTLYTNVDWRDEARWLGLDALTAGDLFFAFGGVDHHRTPAEAVAVLRHLAETGIVDWSIK